MDELEIILNRTSMIAAEALFEMNPTDRMDGWCDEYLPDSRVVVVVKSGTSIPKNIPLNAQKRNFVHPCF